MHVSKKNGKKNKVDKGWTAYRAKRMQNQENARQYTIPMNYTVRVFESFDSDKCI